VHSREQWPPGTVAVAAVEVEATKGRAILTITQDQYHRDHMVVEAVCQEVVVDYLVVGVVQ
jgi:hypothetical protein